MQESPAKLGTPLVVGFCYVSSIDSPAGLLCFADAACYVCYQDVPCCPDQGADPRWHVRSLDKYIYRSNLVLSTFRFLYVLVFGVIEFNYLVLSTGTSSFTLKFLILLQDISLSYSRLGDYVCTLHLMVNVLFFLLTGFSAKLGTSCVLRELGIGFLT